MTFDAVDRLERSVLGAMLLDNDVVGDAVTLPLDAEDFRADAHRRLYLSLRSLWDAGRVADAAGLAEDLHRRGWLADAGGYDYLAKLMEAACTRQGAPFRLEEVRNRAVVRRLHDAGADIAAFTASGDGDAEQLLEDAERRIFAIAEGGHRGGAVPIGQEVPRILARLADRVAGRCAPAGLPTGLADLDDLTGGLRDSELLVLAARPGVGKTALGAHLACERAVRGGDAVLFVSLEMSRAELADRVACALAHVDASVLRTTRPSATDDARLREALACVREAPLFVDDRPAQRLAYVAAAARRLKRRHGLRLVVVDYLQLVEPEDRRAPRHEQVGSISRRLKGLAKELSVPVVALCQLSRAAEEGEGPRLWHLRESGAIEADADAVLLLHRSESEPGVVECDLAKNRNGPVGAFRLRFVREHTRFENCFAVG